MPPALLEIVGSGQAVLVVEPRRIAARASAARVAQEQGVDLGTRVGYRIRFEHRSRPDTRLLYLTEGILLARLQSDPFLEGVGAVVFDEFHERRLDSDLALALCRQVREEARPDLKLLVMSATLDPAPLVDYFGRRGPVPAIESEGRLHPVEVRYLARPDDRPLVARVEAGIRRALQETEGSVLAFLPGVGEIRALERRLRERAVEGVAVRPLYGDLTPERQHAALQRGSGRRVVLATNVAETSVTVEGVSSVVDGGFARSLRYDAASGLDRLELRRISRASADQRTGRAGREGPGVCFRLWTESEHTLLAERDLPEVQRVDLAGALLQLAVWGESDPLRFDWFEAPDGARAERSLELLRELGALDARGATALGLQMAALPVHPRLARLLLEARAVGISGRGALAAALLQERDLFASSGRRGSQGTTEAVVPETRSDLLDRVEAVEGSMGPEARGGEHGARQGFRGRAQAVRRAAAQLERLLDRAPSEPSDQDADELLLRVLVCAYPDRVARRRSEGSHRAVMVGGRGLRQSSESGVRAAPLYLALRVGGSGSEGTVFLASEVVREWLAPELLGEESGAIWDETRERVVGYERRLYRDLELERREVPVPLAEAEALLARRATADPQRALGLDREPVAVFLARLDAARDWEPGLPAIDQELLERVIPALCQGRRSFAELRQAPLLDTLRGSLGWDAQREIDRLAPERIDLGNGRTVAVQYRAGEPPLVAATIQTFFGVGQTPRVAGGRVPVLLHLLAPNQRPQQVTTDLESFWRNTYAEVRKELAGRYPKHPWPEDPENATPPPARGRRR